MDSITQAALGAAIGQEVLGKKIGNKGAVLGAIIATIPDLDIILFPFLSSLERLSMHRGFSHSILFSVLFSFILAWLLSKRKWMKEVSYCRSVIFSFLCLFTHIILDAFTSYGTLLYLPFSDDRVGFDSINVVDPVYTVPLLIGLLCTLWFYRKSTASKKFNRIGLVFSTLYLFSTLLIKSYANDHFISALATNDIQYTNLTSQPVGVASMRWYAVATSNDGIYIGDYSFKDQNDISFTFFPFNDHFLQGIDSHLVDRMKWFAKGNYHVVEENEIVKFYNLQVDMQGIVELEYRKAPTIGYFTITKHNSNTYILGSDRHIQ